MAEFEDVFRESQRMCSTYSDCTDRCPLYDDENCRCMCHALYTSGTETAAEIERIVMKWAAAHPEKTYPSWRDAWQSLFPGADDPCPEQWFGEECPKVADCSECLGMPMSKEVAEKLGIKPITTEKAVPEHDGCEGCRWMDKDEDEEPCKNCCGVMGGSAPDLWEER